MVEFKNSLYVAASTSLTAKVWAGVPLIGHVYVCTPHTVYWKYAKKTNGETRKVATSITTKPSYTSAGVALVTYSHYESWGEISQNPSKYTVNATGHCDFVFKGCPVSMGLQTFLYYGSLE